jgi:hypothetical protein
MITPYGARPNKTKISASHLGFFTPTCQRHTLRRTVTRFFTKVETQILSRAMWYSLCPVYAFLLD